MSFYCQKLMMKKQMPHNQGKDEMMPKAVEETGDGGDGLTRRQQLMQRKKQNRKKLRQKRLQEEDAYDDDGNENGREGPVIDCMMAPWSDWSECSVTCGVGVIMKTRMIKVEPQNGGKRCKGKLAKKKKCRQRKCRKFSFHFNI